MSTSPTLNRTKSKLRDPPPALFLGPPSQNASHVTLPGILMPGTIPAAVASPTTGPAQRGPLLRQSSNLNPGRAIVDGPGDAPLASRPRQTNPRQQERSENQRQADRTDALWAEMQSTLEEVELSASNGAHVFGPDHNRALEELRTAQISLAQAWARSEADDAIDAAEKESKRAGLLGSDGKSALEGTQGAKSTLSGSGSRPGSSGGAPKRAEKLEEETEADILLARKRRDANDRYFQRVNGSVLDVVAKLEGVAVAMRAVEQESRDIWGEDDTNTDSVVS